MAYSSFLRTETKDQTEDSRSSRRLREADKQKARKGVWEKGQDKELGSVWGGLSPSRHLRPRRIKQRQCDGQSLFFKRSSLRQPTSPTVQGFLAAFLWPSGHHAIQGVVKTHDLSPLPLPWLKSGCWSGQPSTGILQHTSASWQTGLGFVLQGFGGIRGSNL